ncbi:reverse transcriptase [Phytophthora megakarya]|uniref:Reverse transcriptase n=1 Tax=Phytophthora megakarya TaxID=4795 RepID=A0A225VHP7_9STRA|nr:reverse transcriptase [Phytophthora megakarya]
MLKAILRGETTKLSYKEARDAWNWSNKFVLSSDNILYYVGPTRRKSEDDQPELSLKLVVPTTMIQEWLKNCHDSIERGHEGVVRSYQRSCLDCSSSKSAPQLKGYSPGNVLAERPFQVVSMDFVIPLPKSRRGNTALLLWQCSFTGFVIANAMSDTDALTVATVFEECMYRRFGAPSLIRHDASPHERSKVTIYIELSSTSKWSTRALSEDSHAVMHGWDAHTTLRAMTTSLKRGIGKQSEALAWRREINRQQQMALEMAKEYQATEKARRAREHNEKLSRKEQAACPQENTDNSGDDNSTPQSLFQAGNRVWLYMERVKPGLVKKVAHRQEWIPILPMSRLKAVNEFCDRPKTRLAQDITEDTRLDFDEELLPEDSWEPDTVAGEFEVEAIVKTELRCQRVLIGRCRSLKSSGLVMKKRRGNQQRIALVVVSCTITYEIKGAKIDSKWSKSLMKTS